MEEVVSCLKYTSLKTRTDLTLQSIYEAMAELKERSSLKRCLPLKPVKREVKLWVRCDSKTDFLKYLFWERLRKR